MAPAAQSMQEVVEAEGWDLPAAQSVQNVAAVSTFAWVPAGHAEHAS